MSIKTILSFLIKPLGQNVIMNDYAEQNTKSNTDASRKLFETHSEMLDKIKREKM